MADDSCLICGYNLYVETCHIIPKPEGRSGEGTMKLCPNHHKLYDNGLLSPQEVDYLPLEARKYYRKKFVPKADTPKPSIKPTPEVKAEKGVKELCARIDAHVKAINEEVERLRRKWE